MAKRKTVWQAERVRALRQHLGLTQEELARELGTRQQTISEWETGMYQPRGLSERLLSLVAERAEFEYDVGAPDILREPLRPSSGQAQVLREPQDER
jgi:transcriptional regulator with XRE-family HTH domain